MKYQRVTANFFRYKDNVLLSRARTIVREMKIATIFTRPKPSLNKVEAALMDYEAKLFAASGGGRLYVAAKRESKRKLADLLQELAFYVNSASDGNLVKLYSSGFPVLEHKKKGGIPAIPSEVQIKDGARSGEVLLAFKPVGRDMLYEYTLATEMGTDKLPVWGDLKTTTRSFKNYESGFQKGTTLYFRIRARNKHGASDWSETVLLIIR